MLLLLLLLLVCALQMTQYNEGPVFLLLNPFIDHSRKDLPVDVYETGGAGRADDGIFATYLCRACSWVRRGLRCTWMP